MGKWCIGRVTRSIFLNPWKTGHRENDFFLKKRQKDAKLKFISVSLNIKYYDKKSINLILHENRFIFWHLELYISHHDDDDDDHHGGDDHRHLGIVEDIAGNIVVVEDTVEDIVVDIVVDIDFAEDTVDIDSVEGTVDIDFVGMDCMIVVDMGRMTEQGNLQLTI